MKIFKTSDGSRLLVPHGHGNKIQDCGWSPDGNVVGWTWMPENKEGHEAVPLKHAFSLTDLRYVDRDTGDFHGAKTSGHKLRLEKADQLSVQVKRDDTTLATLKVDRATERLACSFTFLPKNRVAVGTWLGPVPVFEYPSGKCLLRLTGHTEGVEALAPSPDGRFLLTGSGDHTLRIWDPDRNEAVLSLFFAAPEWVAWTPEGYYATSPGGEKLMGWRVSRGARQMADFYPAAQFHKSLYRPDVVQNVLRAGNTQGALALADAARHQPSVMANLVTHPATAGDDRRAGRTIRQPQPIDGSDSGHGHALRPPARDRNGPVSRWPSLPGGAAAGRFALVEPAADKRVEKSWDVELSPGTHRIVVKAGTSQCYGLSDPLEVVFAPDESTYRRCTCWR